MAFTRTPHQVRSVLFEVLTEMEFLRTHVGYFDIIDGGFRAGASWGFIIGLGVMYFVLKVYMAKVRAEKRNA